MGRHMRLGAAKGIAVVGTLLVLLACSQANRPEGEEQGGGSPASGGNGGIGAGGSGVAGKSASGGGYAGTASGASGLGGTANSALGICPGPDGYGGFHGCGDCAGLACQPTDVCGGFFHQSGGPRWEQCSCANGKMACCFRWAGLRCWYGDETPPPCPESQPQHGEACGPVPLACPYGCDDSTAEAYCDGMTWSIQQWDEPLPGGVSSGLPQAPCAGGAGAGGEAGGEP
jgi:hypothetical protein